MSTIPDNSADWADWADLILIAPATANVIGKIANGLYDDLLTNIVCSTAAPVWLAPAMNVKMWQNSIVRENVQKLQKHAFTLIPPEEGSLACGYNGVGRLAKVDIILKKVMAKFGVGEDVLISQKIDNSSNLHNSSTDENSILFQLIQEKLLNLSFRFHILYHDSHVLYPFYLKWVRKPSFLNSVESSHYPYVHS